MMLPGRRHRLSWSAVLTLAILSAACGSRNEGEVTPEEAAASAVGEFVWQDLISEDLDVSQAFYGDLLGWEFEEASRQGERYLLARSSLGYIGGMTHVARSEPDQPVAQWLSYMLVPDVDDAATASVAAGGEVLVSPLDLDAARVAVVTDPQGAVLGLASLRVGLPARDPRVAPNGTFFWRDYLARDVEDARDFYTSLLGIEADQQTRPDTLLHYVLRGAREVGGIVPITGDQVEPNWLPYVRVDDPAALARRATQLGGTVLLEPRADVRNGSLAVVADPQGAAVALQKYPF